MSLHEEEHQIDNGRRGEGEGEEYERSDLGEGILPVVP